MALESLPEQICTMSGTETEGDLWKYGMSTDQFLIRDR